MKLTKKEFEKILKDKVVSECGVTLDVASAEQIYRLHPRHRLFYFV